MLAVLLVISVNQFFFFGIFKKNRKAILKYNAFKNVKMVPRKVQVL